MDDLLDALRDQQEVMMKLLEQLRPVVVGPIQAPEAQREPVVSEAPEPAPGPPGAVHAPTGPTTVAQGERSGAAPHHGVAPEPIPQQGDPAALAGTFLTPSDVASLFHLHVGSIYRIVAGGRLPALKVGTKLMIPAAEVEKYLVDRTVRKRPWAIRRTGGR